MKPIKRSVCMEIKGITNLVHQELNNAKGRPPHPGTMMQKLFLGYLDAHRDRDVYQNFISGAAPPAAFCRSWCGTACWCGSR